MIKTLMIDIEGTLVEHGRAIPGAAHAIAELAGRGFRIRLLTNVSSRPAEELARSLRELGFDGLSPGQIHTAADAARQFLVREGASYTDLLVPDRVMGLFGDLPLNRSAPDYVVVGDVGSRFSYENMSAAFRLLRNGARLLAMQRNLHWEAAGGAMLDAGAYVAALETACGCKAVLAGKPSADFFCTALDGLGPDTALVVGDDQTTDIAGARAIGARAAMVSTGKGRRIDPGLAQPDHVLASVVDLPALVNRLPSRSTLS
ncbi:MAG: HAD hydrolase-like protein [Bauldia sp.]|nr:HAD hydrolase-like protein [Bauldia sp.]